MPATPIKDNQGGKAKFTFSKKNQLISGDQAGSDPNDGVITWRSL